MLATQLVIMCLMQPVEACYYTVVVVVLVVASQTDLHSFFFFILLKVGTVKTAWLTLQGCVTHDIKPA